MKKTRDFLGLPLFRRLYGFGDTLTMRAKMTNAILGGVDRRALEGALPEHPLVRLHPVSPVVLVLSEFTDVVDNADPLPNVSTYREVMLAVVLCAEGATPLFPLVLFVDDPVAVAAGREYHGFPKVPALVDYGPTFAVVQCEATPRGQRVRHEVLRASWRAEPGLLGQALSLVQGAASGLLRAAGADDDTVDLVTQRMLAPSGEIWNLRQVPDIGNPARAAFSQLTRFKPQLTRPSEIRLLGDFTLALPEEPIWQLRRRFFRGGEPAVRLAFQWEATMTAAGAGSVIDTW
jgi:hypothetical protein